MYPKKVLHINTSDTGGAAVAALRIIHSLQYQGIESELWVNNKNTNNENVKTHNSTIEKKRALISTKIGCQVRKLHKSDNKLISSASVIPSSWVKKINNSNFDLVNLHWFQDEMLSINDITKIRKPLCFTLHDMWAFCGLEHYTTDNRWKEGYNIGNKPDNESGFDINKYIWQYKKNTWSEKFHIITPSSWLYQLATQSILFKDFPISRIPNPIDLEVWKPNRNNKLKEYMGLSSETFLILICGTDIVVDKRKGIDLFKEAIEKITLPANKVAIGILGCNDLPKQYNFANLKTVPLGKYKAETDLAKIYNICDLVIVPSRQDNYPNVVLEAQASGIPVIGFDIGGIRDMIIDDENGYLIPAFNTSLLGLKIKQFYESSRETKEKFSRMSLERVSKENNIKKISSAYLEVYKQMLTKV